MKHRDYRKMAPMDGKQPFFAEGARCVVVDQIWFPRAQIAIDNSGDAPLVFSPRP